MYHTAHPNFVMPTPAQQQQSWWQPAPAAAAWPSNMVMPVPGPAAYPAAGWGYPQPAAPLPFTYPVAQPAYPMPQTYPQPPQPFLAVPPTAYPAAYQPAAPAMPMHYASGPMPAPAPSRSLPATTDLVADETVSAIEEIRSQLRAFASTLDALKSSRAA